MNFSPQYYLMILHWNISDRKSFDDSRTLSNILADLNNAVTGKFSILNHISNSPIFSPKL